MITIIIIEFRNIFVEKRIYKKCWIRNVKKYFIETIMGKKWKILLL